MTERSDIPFGMFVNRKVTHLIAEK